MKHLLKGWLEAAGLSKSELSAMGIDAKACARALKDMHAACRDAWQCGFMRGFNGNMSVRLDREDGYALLVTGTCVAKGHLKPCDVALADEEGRGLHGPAISSETAMHVAIYKKRPDVRYVLHVHPAAMLALSLRVAEQDFLRMPLFEAETWRATLAIADACEPGTEELANSTAEGFADPAIKAVFMRQHGLCTVGHAAVEAVGVCEQYEHLAQTQLFFLS